MDHRATEAPVARLGQGDAAQTKPAPTSENQPSDESDPANPTLVSAGTDLDRKLGGSRLPSLGDTIAGKYLIEKSLGDGGMGVVFGARHVVTGKRVALKCLQPRFASDPAFRRRLLREARLAGTARHPNIVDVYDVEWQDGTVYLVMEWLDGEPLSRRLERGRLACDEALAVFDEVLAAVGWAHGNGIVHRDLKPQNVFLCEGGADSAGHVKVLDFGIAKQEVGWGTDGTTQDHRLLLGTPRYMAPEQFMQPTVDARADVYSMGLILLEMLAGAHPFGQDERPPFRICAERVDAALASISKQVSDDVRGAIARALSLEPEDRFASAREFRMALAGRPLGAASGRTSLSASGGALLSASRRALLSHARTLRDCAKFAVGGAVVGGLILGIELARSSFMPGPSPQSVRLVTKRLAGWTLRWQGSQSGLSVGPEVTPGVLQSMSRANAAFPSGSFPSGPLPIERAPNASAQSAQAVVMQDIGGPRASARDASTGRSTKPPKKKEPLVKPPEGPAGPLMLEDLVPP